MISQMVLDMEKTAEQADYEGKSKWGKKRIGAIGAGLGALGGGIAGYRASGSPMFALGGALAGGTLGGASGVGIGAAKRVMDRKAKLDNLQIHHLQKKLASPSISQMVLDMEKTADVVDIGTQAAKKAPGFFARHGRKLLVGGGTLAALGGIGALSGHTGTVNAKMLHALGNKEYKPETWSEKNPKLSGSLSLGIAPALGHQKAIRKLVLDNPRARQVMDEHPFTAGV